MTDVYALNDVKKDNLVCNNINLNFNGLNVPAIREPLTSLLQAQAETEGSNTGISDFNGKDISFFV